MMRGTTAPRFIWNSGIEFARLARAVVEYFHQAGKRFSDHSEYRVKGIFKVYRSNCEERFEFSDAPWEDDPWPKNETTDIHWQVLDRRGPWASFYVKRELDQPFVEQGIESDKVHVMLMSFNGRLWAPLGESEVEFEALVEKYGRIKELFRLLDCDEIIAWDEYYVYDYEWQAKFPMHRDKLFRFAKEGTQVLVKRMEERRMSSQADWLHSRVFIDPPSVQT